MAKKKLTKAERAEWEAQRAQMRANANGRASLQSTHKQSWKAKPAADSQLTAPDDLDAVAVRVVAFADLGATGHGRTGELRERLRTSTWFRSLNLVKNAPGCVAAS
jgi:hypothetical protein